MSTTVADLRQQLAPREAAPLVHTGLANNQEFELSQRVAKMMASSNLVPKEYQGNIPNCVIALNMASRVGADPLMVMQNLYVVHGRPGWSSQFLIATFNQSGRFSALRYEWSGTEGKDDWTCRAYAVEKATGETLKGSWVSIGTAKKEGWYDKNGSKWKTMPQQMLMYRAASWFVRAYAPELSMGLQTVDEVRDVYDAVVTPTGEYEVQAKAEVVDPATGEVIEGSAEDFWGGEPKDAA